MGYSTDFHGHFAITPPLTAEQRATLVDWSQERHEWSGVPSYWCQWVPTDDGKAIHWDGVEKFYEYEDWLLYIIEHFIAPWGCKLNGEVEWAGEDSEDLGRLVVKDNVLTVFDGVVEYRARARGGGPRKLSGSWHCYVCGADRHMGWDATAQLLECSGCRAHFEFHLHRQDEGHDCPCGR